MTPLNLESMFPDLYRHALSLHGDTVVVGFLIVLIGMTLKFWRGMFGDIGETLRGLLTASIIAISIPLFPDWINQIQTVSHEYVAEIGANPDETNQRFAKILMSESNGEQGSFGFWDVIWSDQTSFGEELAYAAVYLASQCAWALMWLYFIVQQAVLIYAIGLTPIFISFFMMESMRSVARQFILNTLAVAFWPLGWAIAGMLTHALMDMSVGTENTLWGGTQSLFFIIMLTIWIVYSTIKAPLLILQLLTKGISVGGALFSGFAASITQGATSSAVAGVSSHMVGSRKRGILASGVMGGVAGTVAGAAGSSNMLMPSVIGLGVGVANRRPKANSNISEKAKELYNGSKNGG